MSVYAHERVGQPLTTARARAGPDSYEFRNEGTTNVAVRVNKSA